MKYEFSVYRMTVESHIFWVAESKSLKGCVGQGETSQEAITELEQNEAEWLETALDVGIPIPAVSSRSASIPSGKFALRLAPNVYSQTCEISNELDISMNQYINNAIIEYNTRNMIYLRTPVSEGTDSADEAEIIHFPAFKRKQEIQCVEIDEREEM